MLAEVKAPASVVIPCYCCPDTIGRAVASVAGQTWRPRELILVDDASSDDTPKVLCAMQNRYGEHWIKVILREENGGPGVARNNGWELATQPFVAFLDADDTWHERKLEIQCAYMEEHPEVLISGHRWTLQELLDMPTADIRVTPVTFCRQLLRNHFATPTVMVRREVPIRFEEGKRYSEDFLLWLEILSLGPLGQLIDAPLTRLHKPPYGAGGLSGHLWEMEKGELDTYARLLQSGRISFLTYQWLVIYSLLKHIRRCVLLALKR